MLQIKLISLYYYICQLYSTELRWQVQRFSNNNLAGQITDEELLTIYLFGVSCQEKYQLKSMYTYIQTHWLDWFPQLPSYQTFVSRLNRLSDSLPLLVERLSAQLLRETKANDKQLLVDSLPIITCSAKRVGKVAPRLTAKGYCASKDLYYIGCKLHLIGATRPQTRPIPQQAGLTPASIHDLTALRPVLPQFYDTTILADKAYSDQPLNKPLQQEQNTYILTPVKQVKGQCKHLQQFDHAHDSLLSQAVSARKQPLESFFNFLQQKTNIQIASKVRSCAGLIVHTLGKLAAALISLLLFNS